MQDEVSVTVIATGIDSPAERRASAEGWEPTEENQEDIDIPAYLRRKVADHTVCCFFDKFRRGEVLNYSRGVSVAVYLDLLLLVNFAFNFVLLVIAGWMGLCKFSLKRYGLAALAGAIICLIFFSFPIHIYRFAVPHRRRAGYGWSGLAPGDIQSFAYKYCIGGNCRAVAGRGAFSAWLWR